MQREGETGATAGEFFADLEAGRLSSGRGRTALTEDVAMEGDAVAPGGSSSSIIRDGDPGGEFIVARRVFSRCIQREIL